MSNPTFEVHRDRVRLEQIAVEYGTPVYVYSQQAIVDRFEEYRDALAGIPHRICYAVKANSNLSILGLLAREGAGFDIVSAGELHRVLKAGGDPARVVFSGVGKSSEEIRYGLERGIDSFHCESEAELEMISAVASADGRTASIALRVNPDVDVQTHPYISTGLREHKFGVSMAEAERLYGRAAGLAGIAPSGVSCHIGSQILDTTPLLEAAARVMAMAERLRSSGLPIRYLDLGGGIGVPYRSDERSPDIRQFVRQLRALVEPSGLTLMLEPGRSLVAEAGVLLSRVILIKENGLKKFVVLDAAMNDLLRPSLYQAHHEIAPVQERGTTREKVDIVGPVCESGDFFARDREMPRLEAGDLVAIKTAGAYGFSLASNYNSRPRPCEVLLDGDQVRLIRQRETLDDLIRGEVIP